MKKKYHILVLTLLSLFLGQSSYAFDDENGNGFTDEYGEFNWDAFITAYNIDSDHIYTTYEQGMEYLNRVNSDNDPSNDLMVRYFYEPEKEGTTVTDWISGKIGYYDYTVEYVNVYDENGYDRNGYDTNGFNLLGLDSSGHDIFGIDANGKDREGNDYSGLERPDDNDVDIDDPPTPVIPPIPVTIPTINPCEQANTLNTNQGFKEKINFLKTKTDNPEHKEFGFSKPRVGDYKPLIPVEYSNKDDHQSLDYKPTSADIGYMHCHIEDFYGEDDELRSPIQIFSPKDIESFLILLNRNHYANNSLDDNYAAVVTSTGTYILTFNGTIPHFTPKATDYNDKEEYKKYINDSGLEEGFLLYLKEKIGVSGINLTKIENDNTIKKIELDSKNELVKKPC